MNWFELHKVGEYWPKWCTRVHLRVKGAFLKQIVKKILKIYKFLTECHVIPILSFLCFRSNQGKGGNY